MSREQDKTTVNRADFLRLAAVGAGGLGLTALAGCGRTRGTVWKRKGRIGCWKSSPRTTSCGCNRARREGLAASPPHSVSQRSG